MDWPLLLPLVLFIFSASSPCEGSFEINAPQAFARKPKEKPTPLCTFLNRIAAFPPLPDGFSGPLFQNFSWVSHSCSPDSRSLRYDSGWVNEQSKNIQFDWISTKVTNLMVSRSVWATWDPNDLLSFNITLQFRATFNIDTEQDEFAPTISGLISKMKEPFPIAASTDFNFGWKGSTSTDRNSNISIQDWDLFDGVIPALILNPHEPDTSLFPYIDRFITSIGNINFRMGPLDSMPSSATDSIRGKFLSSLPKVEGTYAIGGKLMGFESLGDGILLQMGSNCQGSLCETLIFSLGKMITSSIFCNTLNPNLDSFAAYLDVDIFVTNSSVLLRSLHGSSHGLFSCGEMGYLSIYLSKWFSASSAWPLIPYLGDVNSAAGLTRSMKTVSQGEISGTIDSDRIYTALGSDLFSGNLGGLLFPDLDLDLNTIAAVFGQICGALRTDIGYLDEAVGSIFPLDPSSLIDQYTFISQRPTLLGFLLWFVERTEGLDVMVSSVENSIGNITFPFSFVVSTPLQSNKAVMDTVNSVIQSLGKEIYQKYPLTQSLALPNVSSSYQMFSKLAGLLSGSVIVTNETSASLSGPRGISAMVAVEAYFQDDLNQMFTCLNVTYDFVLNQFTVIGFLSSQAKQIVNSASVTLDDNGQLITDFTWINPSHLAARFQDVAIYVSQISWASSPLIPVNLSPGIFCGEVSWYDLLSGLEDLVSLLPGSISAFDLTFRIQNYFLHFCQQPNTLINVHILPDSSQKLNIDIHVRSLHRVSIATEDMPWKFVVDTSRISVPMIFEMQLKFSMDEIISVIQIFGANGLGYLSGWSTPFLAGMLSGSVRFGDILLSVDLPGNSFIEVNMNITTDVGDIIHSQIIDMNLGSVNNSLNFLLSKPSEKMVSPMSLLANLRDGIFKIPSSMLNGPLNFPLLNLKENLGPKSTFNNSISKIVPWLSLPSKFNPPLVLSSSVCSDSITMPISLNITMNQYPFVICQISDIDKTSLQTVTQGINKSLTSCGLGRFLTARVGQQTIDSRCGKVGLYQAIPGILWRFTISSNASIFAAQWFSETVPIFATWKDLAWLLSSVFDSKSMLIAPNFTTVSIDDLADFVDPELRPVYPKQLPAIFLTFSIQHFNQIEVSINDHINGLDSMSFAVKNGTMRGMMQTSIFGTLGTVFGCAPLGGGVNISVLSNLGANQTNIPIPPSPNNTFIISIAAQLRSDQIVPIQYDQQISLTPGKPFLEALQTDFMAQISESIQPLVSVSISPGNPTLKTNDQIRIALSRQRGENGTWLIPLSLGIRTSTIPFLGNATNTPPTSRTVVSNLTTTACIDLDTSAARIDGMLGIVDFSSQSILGESEIRLEVQLNDFYGGIASIMTAATHRSNFFGRFSLTLILDAIVNTSAIDFDISTIQIGNAALSMSLNGRWFLTNLDDLNNLTQQLNWNVAVYGDDVLDSLLQLNTSSICDWMQQIGIVSDNIAEKQISRSLLPFSQSSLNSLFDNGVGKVFKDLGINICRQKQKFTLALFCALMKDTFGKNICQNSVLNGSSLVIELELIGFNITQHDQFRFDTPMLFPNSELPIAFGTSAAISLRSIFDIKLQLVADFSNSLKLSLGPDTSFSLATEFDIQDGKIAAFIGPLSITFANVQAIIGAPVLMSVSVVQNNDVSLTVTGYANFETMVKFLGEDLCQLQIGITDLGSFLSGNMAAVIITENLCGSGFVDQIGQALIDNSIFNFFSQPSLFIAQFQNGINSIIDKLFGINGAIGPLLVPLVDRLVQDITTKELRSLIGPQITKQLIVALTDMTTDILLHHHLSFNETLIDELVLEGFTKLLCQEFGKVLMTCPPVPSAVGPEYNWTLYFGAVKTFEIPNIGFALGNHGLASLSLSCGEVIVIGWNLTFTLSYSETHGIKFYFDHSPIFSVDVWLDFTPDCKLSGNIGFLGVEIDPRGGLSGRLEVDLGFKARFEIDADIIGTTELGFAGPLADKIINDKDAIQALPHWKLYLELRWKWSLDARNPTPKITMSNITMCLGRIIGHMLNSVAKEANKILGPLDRVLGPDGILQKDVPATKFIFGKEMTVAEFLYEIVQFYCKGECVFNGVFEALEMFVKISQDVEKFTQIVNMDPEGCFLGRLIQSFEADFTQDSVHASTFGPLPPSDLQFNNVQLNAHKEMIADLYSSMTTSGEFGIRFHIFDDVPNNIIKLLLGEDIPLAGVTIPKLTIGVVAQWYVIVWPFPTVEIFVEIGATLVADVGEITFMANGIVNAIRTESPGKLISSIAIPTTYSDGSPRWPLQGSIRLSGGASVSLWIVDAAAYVFIELDGRVRIMDIEGDNYVTFDEIVWLIRANDGNLFAALETELDLKAGFGIYLEACIDLLFYSKCWTIIRLEWSAVLFYEQWGPRMIEPIASSDGKLNLNALQSNSFSASATPSLVRVYESSECRILDYFPSDVDPSSGVAPFSRCTSSLTTVGYYGNAGALNYIFEVRGVMQLVQLPPSQSVQLRLLMSSYPTITSYRITSNSVSPNTASGVTIIHCSSVSLESPLDGVTISVEGVPCPTTISSLATSNVTISGMPQLYSSPVVIIGEAYFIGVSVQSTEYTISATSVVGNNPFSLVIPEHTQNLQVHSHPTWDSIFYVTDVSSESMLSAVGGSGDDLFVLPALGNLKGSTLLDGGQGVNSINLVLFGSDGQQIVASSHSLVQKNVEESFVVNWQNLQQRNITIISQNFNSLDFTLVSPEEGAFVQVWSVGANQSSITQQITGCDGKSEIRIFLTNSGNHTVILGNNNKVSSFHCTIRITGGNNPNQIDSVILQASQDTVPLHWELGSGTLNVWDPNDASNKWFLLYFSELERMTIEFGSGGTELDMTEGTLPTEYLLSFPTSYNPNLVRIYQTTNATFLNGSFSLDIGPAASKLYSVNPMNNIYGMVAVSAAIQGVLITLDSGSGPNAPSQSFMLDQSCLDPLNEAKNIPQMVSVPSPWMCEILIQNGFTNNCKNCHINFLGNTSFNILTGSANDYFNGANVIVPVALSLAEGADIVLWNSSGSTGSASFDLGAGEDILTLVIPISKVIAILGQDEDVDVVDVWAGNMHPPPQVNGNTLSSLPSPNDYSVLGEYYKQDLVYLRRENPSNCLVNSSRESNNVSMINVTESGVVFKYDMTDNVTYQIVNCGEESTIVLDARGGSSLSPAQNWHVLVSLSSFDTPAYINVYAIKGTNGIITVSTPEIEGGSYDMLIHEASGLDGFGTITVGGLRVQPSNVDHLVIDAKTVINVLIDGTPANADLVVFAPSTSNFNLQKLKNNIFLVNVTGTIPSNIIKSGVSIITSGTGSNLTVDCSFSHEVQFIDGCLVTVPSLPFGVGSSWFIGQLESLRVPINAINCLIFANQTNSVNISAPFVSSSGLGSSKTTKILVINQGNVVLNDTTSWLSSIIEGDTLFVDNRYQVVLSNQSQAWVTPFVFTINTVLEIKCPSNSTRHPKWNLGDKALSVIGWQGPSCTGVVNLAEPWIPSMVFSGNGTALVDIDFWSLLSTERTILMSSNTILANVSGMSLISISVDAFLNVTLIATFSDGQNEISMHSFRWLPKVIIGELASANLHLDSSASIEFPSQQLEFDWKNHFIIPTEKQTESHCLHPDVSCSPQAWLDLAAHGGTPCSTEEQHSTCMSLLALELETNHSILCFGSTIEVNPHESGFPVNYASWTLVVFSMFFFASSVATSIGWIQYRTFFNFGWLNLVITGFLSKLQTDKNWNLEVRSLVQSANQVAGDMFTGWFCGKNSVNNIGPLIAVIESIVIILACVALLNVAVEYFLSKLRPPYFTIIHRGLSSLGIFIFMPFVISHIASSESIAALVFLIFLFIQICIEAIRLKGVKRPANIYTEDDNEFGKEVNRWKNLGLVVVILAGGLIASVFGHPDVHINSTSFFSMMVFLVVLTATHGVYSSLLFIRIENRNKLIAASLLEIISSIFGLAFIALIYSSSEQPSHVFFIFWFLWIVLPWFSPSNPLVFRLIAKVESLQKTSALESNKPLLPGAIDEVGDL